MQTIHGRLPAETLRTALLQRSESVHARRSSGSDIVKEGRQLPRSTAPAANRGTSYPLMCALLRRGRVQGLQSAEVDFLRRGGKGDASKDLST